MNELQSEHFLLHQYFPLLNRIYPNQPVSEHSLQSLASRRSENRGSSCRSSLVPMASSILATRSLISTKLLLSCSGRLLLPRGLILLEKRACSQLLKQVKQAPLSRSSGPLRCRFYSAAGIVKSDLTVDIPEISLSDFVLNKFKEYGDDTAMVSKLN